MRVFKVLVADNDEAVRKSVVTLLEVHGHEGVAAEAGATTLEELEAWPECQLVITDFATLVAMRNNGPHERIRTLPVIVYSATPSVKDSVGIFHGEYVDKNIVASDDLLKVIAKVIPKPKARPKKRA